MVNRNKDEKLDSEIAKRLDDLFGEGDALSDESGALEDDRDHEAENKSKVRNRSAADGEIFELDEVVVNKKARGPAADDDPFAELKSMVLSIDWEITDEVLNAFISQIAKLKNAYKNQKIILMFLQLLGSLGEYIKTNRGNAHPKTFKVLNSVFARLEEVVLTEDLAESEKIKILRIEMDKYKKLRSQVSQKKAAEVRRGKAVPLRKDRPYESARRKLAADISLARRAVPPQAAPKKPVSVSAAAKPHATLAEAVEDLKQFIHAELNALRQELKRIR